MFKLAMSAILLVAFLAAAHAQTPRTCPQFRCTRNIDEVCGLDLVTYTNRCNMRASNCADDILFYTGACREPAECDIQFSCTTEYQPVCATDGNTYRNECILLSQRCHEETVDYKGECQS